LEFGTLGEIIRIETDSTMARISKAPHRIYGKKNLIPRDVIVVRVASFTFRFETVEELRQCIKYFQQKIHPSSRIAAKRFEAEFGKNWRSLRGWDLERWFERLPMYLLEEPKRQKVLKALCKALGLVKSEKL
jgi:hypothetical protein